MSPIRVSLEEVKKRLFAKHGDIVSIVESTFINQSKKAIFIDKDFGEWCAKVGHVCNGSSHPKRGKLKYALSFKKSYPYKCQKRKDTCMLKYGTEYVSQNEEIKKKIRDTNMLKYGVPNCMQNINVFLKNCKANKKTFEKKHWKTGEELVCVGGYEVAFVNWCNANQIDFDWQIPYKMPNDRIYYVDAFIKTGEFTNTWIEIKGYWDRRSGPESKDKWETFHILNLNSELWDYEKLNYLKILVGKKPNPKFGEK